MDQDTTKNEIESAAILIADYGFESVYKTDYAEALINNDRKILACILMQDYIPIKHFKETFEKLYDLTGKDQFRKFIFDKRSLRTFHQPSMEWYYIEWKTKMLEKGVTSHRKILPDLKWFAKAVEIAKRPLLKKMPEDIKNRLDINYCDSLVEAVNV